MTNHIVTKNNASDGDNVSLSEENSNAKDCSKINNHPVIIDCNNGDDTNTEKVIPVKELIPKIPVASTEEMETSYTPYQLTDGVSLSALPAHIDDKINGFVIDIERENIRLARIYRAIEASRAIQKQELTRLMI